MPATTLKTPRTSPRAAPHETAPSLTPNEGAKPTNTVQMTRAQWKATPRDYKIYSRKTGRFVMQHSPRGIGLFPVQIID
ncbi:MAG: hypothetical protein PHO64_01670 [Thiomonas sp.]|nr:hypothetical protein [Thiomonas sp.]